jgi:tRNA-specific 2-thiouridylase
LDSDRQIIRAGDHAPPNGDWRRVVVAMSGGVDSSVAAALAVEQGYDVVGIMLRLWSEEQAEGGSPNLCCALDAVQCAEGVAQGLGIPLYLLNAGELFRQQVVEPFISAYAAGETPNPCLACNRHIRFGFLQRHATALGADLLVTGHYARVRSTGEGSGTRQLLRGVDGAKDQSYVLYMLDQDALRHVWFPLGGLTKAQVRRMAHQRGLAVAERAESQDLCFVRSRDYRGFLRRYAPDTCRPGAIVDEAGHPLGKHGGLAFYTVGQRRGLGIAATEPLYVLELDVCGNRLVVGPESALGGRELTAQEVSFVAGHRPCGDVRAQVQVRYHATARPAAVRPLPSDRARVIFDETVRDITPGQGAVFYDGEVCLGGGLIERRPSEDR